MKMIIKLDRLPYKTEQLCAKCLIFAAVGKISFLHDDVVDWMLMELIYGNLCYSFNWFDSSETPMKEQKKFL